RLRDRIPGPMSWDAGGVERGLAECRAAAARIGAVAVIPAGAVGSSGGSGFGAGDRAALAEVVGTILDLVERVRAS
ncbi:MAG TPA: hypothetical protein VH092_05825, partial [Urbifossiella sp.]|nr:hypothetical protein [Urbifossiella sp.]